MPRATRPSRRQSPGRRGDANRRPPAVAPRRSGRTRPGSPAYRRWSITGGASAADPFRGRRGLVLPYRGLQAVLTAATEARIQGIAERVTQEVERENGREDRDAGTDAHPPLQVREVTLRVVDVLA